MLSRMDQSTSDLDVFSTIRASHDFIEILLLSIYKILLNSMKSKSILHIIFYYYTTICL